MKGSFCRGAQEMTYIDRLNEFNRWLESNALPGNAQLMYFRLLNVFNRAGWPEWVQVDALRLMELTGCRKDAAFRARDRLAEAGFIAYRKGGKGRPTAYCLRGAEYTVEKDSENDSVIDSVKDSENATESATESATENATHIKNKNKTKTKKKKKRDLCPPVKSYDIEELEKLSHLRLPEDM